jgi:hypothetical protein
VQLELDSIVKSLGVYKIKKIEKLNSLLRVGRQDFEEDLALT